MPKAGIIYIRGITTMPIPAAQAFKNPMSATMVYSIGARIS